MKKILLASLFFFAVSGFLRAEKVYKTYTDMGEVEGPALAVSEVLASRDEYHRQIITVEGQIGKLTFKETGNGRKFTLFRFFEDDPENRVNVYARGYVEGIENGSRLRIWGRYSKHKKYFLFKRKNIMKAKKIQILKGLK